LAKKKSDKSGSRISGREQMGKNRRKRGAGIRKGGGQDEDEKLEGAPQMRQQGNGGGKTKTTAAGKVESSGREVKSKELCGGREKIPSGGRS